MFVLIILLLAIISVFDNIMNEKKICGYSSGVERDLAKVDAARSNRVTRFLKEFISKK